MRIFASKAIYHEHLDHCTLYTGSLAQSPSEADATPLLHAINGQVVAHVGNESLDFESILAYGREIGNTNLRRLTFQQRGLMLKRLALHF